MRRLALSIAFSLVVIPLGATPAVSQQALERSIRSLDPELRLSVEDGLQVTGDFSGDGRADWAVVLEGESRRAFVIFNASPSGFVAYPLYTHLPDGAISIYIRQPGRVRVAGVPGTIVLRNPSPVLRLRNRTAAVYRWNGSAYRAHTLAETD